MSCKCKCSRCGLHFDLWSGRLINLSDSALQWFYRLPYVSNFLKYHKHCVLCSNCLEAAHSIQVQDLKFKNGRWMTSNAVYLIHKNPNYSDRQKYLMIEHLKTMNNAGVLPYKGNQTVQLFKDLEASYNE